MDLKKYFNSGNKERDLSIKNVEKQMHDIHSKKEETKTSQIKGEQHPIDLNKTVNFICERFDEYERDRTEKGKIINELQKNVNDMFATIESLKGCLDRQEQHSRRNCLANSWSLGIKKPK